MSDGFDGRAVALNLAHKDPVLRKIFQNHRLRVALFHAINREAINQAIYFCLARARQTSALPISKFYIPEHEQAYLEYDPEKSNRILDEIGLSARDRDGMRLRPDAKTLALYIEAGSYVVGADRLLEMLSADWQAVGVLAKPRLLARQLFDTRTRGSLHDANLGTQSGGMNPPFIANYWIPDTWAHYGMAFVIWFQTGGEKGERPPPEMLRRVRLLEQIRRTLDESEQIRLWKEALRRNELYTIGIVGGFPSIGIVHNTVRNVPEVGLNANYVWRPGAPAPESWAIVE